MNEIINFLVKPTKTAEHFVSKTSSEKYIIGMVILLISSLIGLLLTYITPSLFKSLQDVNYYLQSFIYSIIFSLIFITLIWGVGKVLGGKAKFEDVLGITMMAYITTILANLFMCIILGTQTFSLSFVGLGIYFIAFIWFLVIWSKGLSVVEKVSETKITLIVVISIVLIYLVSTNLSPLLGGYSLF